MLPVWRLDLTSQNRPLPGLLHEQQRKHGSWTRPAPSVRALHVPAHDRAVLRLGGHTQVSAEPGVWQACSAGPSRQGCPAEIYTSFWETHPHTHRIRSPSSKTSSSVRDRHSFQASSPSPPPPPTHACPTPAIAAAHPPMSIFPSPLPLALPVVLDPFGLVGHSEHARDGHRTQALQRQPARTIPHTSPKLCVAHR